MLTATCDSCGEHVPREQHASVRVSFGRSEAKFDLCARCQYLAISFFEEMVGTEVLSVSRERWTAQERAQFEKEETLRIKSRREARRAS